MSEMKFTKQQIKDWHKYEIVRLDGTWNMYAPNARYATGLSEDRYLFVLHNYSELKDYIKSAEHEQEEKDEENRFNTEIN